MLDYEYIKNHNTPIAFDLSRQKELDADPKTIQKIDFFGKSKNNDGVNADDAQSMFVFKILDKIKETRPIFSQGSITIL